jgi:hypothetical protein
MCKKTLLILFAFTAAAIADTTLPPLAPPPTIHQFKVHYACQGSKEMRDVLVDADDEDDARAIIEDMIPCAVIMKITEVILYEENVKTPPRMSAGAKQGRALALNPFEK